MKQTCHPINQQLEPNIPDSSSGLSVIGCRFGCNQSQLRTSAPQQRLIEETHLNKQFRTLKINKNNKQCLWGQLVSCSFIQEVTPSVKRPNTWAPPNKSHISYWFTADWCLNMSKCLVEMLKTQNPLTSSHCLTFSLLQRGLWREARQAQKWFGRYVSDFYLFIWVWTPESRLTDVCVSTSDDFGSDEEDNDFGEEEDEDGGSDYEEKKGKKGKKVKPEKPAKRAPKRKRAAGNHPVSPLNMDEL